MKTQNQNRKCSTCSTNIYGRKDKVFCSQSCKNKHHKIAKLQILESRNSVNLQLNRNNVVLTGLMGRSRSKIVVNKNLLFQYGYDLDHYDDKVEGTSIYYIGDFEVKELNNNKVEICRVEELRRVFDVFFKRWEVEIPAECDKIIGFGKKGLYYYFEDFTLIT